MIVHPGKDGRSRRRTYGVCHIAVIEPHALLCQPVEVRRVVDTSAIAADGFGCVIIGEDEDDIRLFHHPGSAAVTNSHRLDGDAGRGSHTHDLLRSDPDKL